MLDKYVILKKLKNYYNKEYFENILLSLSLSFWVGNELLFDVIFTLKWVWKMRFWVGDGLNRH